MKKLSKNLVDVVSIINDNKYIDGDTIGTKLGITRSAVWKIVKKLKQYGIEIISVKRKGYSFKEELILLDEDKIKNSLINPNIEIEIFESIVSTNDYLKSIIVSGVILNDYDIKVCLTEHQSRGRGRINRSWHSPFGKNIYLSLRYSLQKDISELSGLSLMISLAIIETVKTLGNNIELMVKWPNDVFHHNEKLAGNIVEIQGEASGSTVVIIGIGINVNMIEIPSRNISQPWCSLIEILGSYIDRNKLCSILINNLLKYLYKFNMEGFAPFLDEWEKLDFLLGKEVSLKCADDIITGYSAGISHTGNILIKMPNGTVQAFSSGDVNRYPHIPGLPH
jgi:BirA family transcriptional regulator, biotin operon repressor / biotin---[acetyl-CoA-carboxylase] ligase